MLAAARWRGIADQCEAKLTIPQALRFTLIGTFFSQTLPSTLGGDAARVWFLARAAGIRNRRSMRSWWTAPPA
jgi:glycosyltransferase 2 family protein